MLQVGAIGREEEEEEEEVTQEYEGVGVMG
jgi:hypothetical protein